MNTVTLPLYKHKKTEIDINQIVRVSSDINYSEFFFSDTPRSIVIAKTMGKFIPYLSQYQFIRPCRGHLINMQFIETVSISRHGGKILLKDGYEIPISRRRLKEVLGRLGTTY
jgi:DNA-binding LytR/AlgR family response regulator